MGKFPLLRRIASPSFAEAYAREGKNAMIARAILELTAKSRRE